MKSPIRVALCYPWYSGPDRDCSASFSVFHQYLGMLQERLYWLSNIGENAMIGWDATEGFFKPYAWGKPPKLDPHDSDAEITADLVGTTMQFGITEEMGCSLPGMARERCVDNALAWGADYIFFSDDDMIFKTGTLLNLYRDHLAIGKPAIVGALAFTGRDPITPVIYNFGDSFSYSERRLTFNSEPVWDYRPDALQPCDAIGGGVFMVSAEAFKLIPKPWFNTTGIGEDIYFCAMGKAHGVPTYVDTRIKTWHKPTFTPAAYWATEERYQREYQAHLKRLREAEAVSA